MKTLARNMGIAALILTSFAIVGTGLVALAYTSTKDIIAQARQAALEASLNQLVPADRYDNRVVEDRIEVVAPDWLGTDQPVTVYRARKNGLSGPQERPAGRGVRHAVRAGRLQRPDSIVGRRLRRRRPGWSAGVGA